MHSPQVGGGKKKKNTKGGSRKKSANHPQRSEQKHGTGRVSNNPKKGAGACFKSQTGHIGDKKKSGF